MGSRRHFRYEDARGRRITDEDQLERVESLAIPPAWKDVWISPRPRAKLQATGVDSAGRRQYLYHADFRARQEREKYDKLIQFAERLPDLRTAMAEHLDGEEFTAEWTSAVAVRLINLGWFRVGSERYATKHRTFGITTLNKNHVTLRGSRVTFRYRGKHSRDGSRSEPCGRRGDALCRREARKHAGRRSILVRESRRCGAVSRRAYDRRLSSAPFTCRRRARYRPR